MLNLPQPLAQAVKSLQATDLAVIAFAISVAAYFVYLRLVLNTIPYYSLLLPYLTQWQFFAKRSEFLSSGFMKVRDSMFKFTVQGHTVVALKSHHARSVFFGDKNLSFTEGYKILFGGSPRLEDINVEAEHSGSDLSWFQNRITHLLRKERLNELLPYLLSDLDRKLNGWSDAGTLDPFVQIYALIFQLTVRGALCNEIADDAAKTARIAQLYEQLETGSNPKSHVFPWLPNAGTRAKQSATKELYQMLSDIVDSKKRLGASHGDTIQELMNLGDSTPDVVGFALGALFAGVLNTTNVACWIPLFLNSNPAWKDKAVAEIKAFLERHSMGNETMAARLSQVAANAWEEDLPVMDLIIRETIRMVASGSALRRNVERELKIDGKLVERGAFMVYPLHELHFDPEIYSDPFKFDPGRYEKGREEDRKVHFGYLGWGVGRHPCLGMRFAKLELKMLTVMLLGSFQFEHVDEHGNPQQVDGHSVDRNSLYQIKPKAKGTYLKYRRISV